MIHFLLIFLGAGLGGTLRYMLQIALNNTQYTLPYGTILVNLAGCYTIGLLSGLSELKIISSHISLLLVTGLLGGFTTFSAFGMETVTLLLHEKYLPATINILISVGGGILLAYVGYRNIKFALGC